MAFDLRTTQDIFWRLTQAPEGVSGALKDFQTSRPGILKSLGDLFQGNETEARARMEIYAQMYFWRLHDCIREDYPVTGAFLGEDNFERLVADYLLAHPSQDPDVALVGGRLPDFLAGHALSANLPFLPDLARLEWMQIEVGREADADVLREADVKIIPPEQWSELQLKTIPALRWVTSSFDIFSSWIRWCLEKGSPQVPEALLEPQHTLIWRRDYQVLLQTVDSEEIQWLHKLKEGISFGEICEALVEEDEEGAPLRAMLFLSHWVQRRILIRSARELR